MSDTPSSVRAEILRFGLYEPTGEQTTLAAPDAVTGDRAEGNSYFIRSGSTLSVRKGQGFGFDYRVYGLPRTGTIKEHVIISHPKIINPSGESFTESRVVLHQGFENGEFKNHSVYLLLEDYEMVGGTWTLEHVHEGKTLLKKSFEITPVR